MCSVIHAISMDLCSSVRSFSTMFLKGQVVDLYKEIAKTITGELQNQGMDLQASCKFEIRITGEV